MQQPEQSASVGMASPMEQPAAGDSAQEGAMSPGVVSGAPTDKGVVAHGATNNGAESGAAPTMAEVAPTVVTPANASPTDTTTAGAPADATWASWDDAPSPSGADDASGEVTAISPRIRRPDLSLGRAFSLRRTVAFGVAPFVALVGVYLLETLAFRGDWAVGALAMGIAAFALATLTLLLWLARLLMGRRARVTALLALALVAALVVVGVGGVALIQPLHRAQAQQFERAGQWSGAIHEYALAGEAPPNAPDIARVYVEWGEQSLGRQQYAIASQTFSAVVARYAHSGAAVAQARNGLYRTYTDWVQTTSTSAPYLVAITYLKTYQQSAACDAACQSAAPDLDAEAYFLYGQQLVASKQYYNAINVFETAQAAYPQTAFARKAHTVAATTYLTYGKQLLTTACGSALAVYQTLAKSYADTPEGHTAQQALAAPQNVTGIIQGFPTNPLPTAYLSKGINLSIFYFSDDYSATINAATGAFTFTQVAQGAYNLSTAQTLSNGTDYRVFKDATSGNVYSIQVGPLCPTNLGALTYAAS
ncbi:MAG TPA: hypothetical protein VMV29_06130 [Ktedonobacterales bacterium]|nr:hypothetical protein [Ktedonobacterales bacterium]